MHPQQLIGKTARTAVWRQLSVSPFGESNATATSLLLGRVPSQNVRYNSLIRRRRTSENLPTNSRVNQCSFASLASSSSPSGARSASREASSVVAESTATRPHSTATVAASEARRLGLEAPSLVETVAPPPPSWKELQKLFIASATPMIGFGFMDNLVMIQAGQYIDSTLGVSLGLATMTAAAAGQVVSDVSGVLCGGTLERILTRLAFIEAPTLTNAQRALPICRNVALLGSAIGVMVGCALGATSLLFLDLEAKERQHRSSQLRDIVTDMLHAESDTDVETENDESAKATGLSGSSCIVYFTSGDQFEMDSASSKLEKGTTRLSLMQDASDQVAVMECAQRGEVLLRRNGMSLFAPVISNKDGNEVMAVVEFQFGSRGSTVEGESEDGFDRDDIRTAKVTARHLGILLAHLVE